MHSHELHFDESAISANATERLLAYYDQIYRGRLPDKLNPRPIYNNLAKQPDAFSAVLMSAIHTACIQTLQVHDSAISFGEQIRIPEGILERVFWRVFSTVILPQYEESIGSRAEAIANQLLIHPGKGMLDFPPPEALYTLPTAQPNITAKMLINIICTASKSIITTEYPRLNYEQCISLPPPLVERLFWRIIGSVKLAPLPIYREGTGRIISYYSHGTWPQNYGEEGHIDMTHNRVKVRLHERYNDFRNRLFELFKTRYKYLQDFFHVATNGSTPKEKEVASSYVAHHLQAIQHARSDFDSFCDQFHLENSFKEKKTSESSSFDTAVNWDNMSRHDRASLDFYPTPAEESLREILPPICMSKEWLLSHFSEFDSEEVQKMGGSDDLAFLEHIRLMDHRQLERKMFLYYHIELLRHLYHDGRRQLSPKSLRIIKNNLPILTREIHDLQKKVGITHVNGIADTESTRIEQREHKEEDPDIARVQSIFKQVENIRGQYRAVDIGDAANSIFHTISQALQMFINTAVHNLPATTSSVEFKNKIMDSLKMDLSENLEFCLSNLESLEEEPIPTLTSILREALDFLQHD